MGFQITTPTAIPLAGDGSHLSPTWGEGGGPFIVPPNKVAGLGSVTLSSNDVNYEWQHDARWIRAIRDRVAFSDEGLLTTCVLFQGAWNIGGGTLGVTLTPTRIVIDVNADGGTIIEVTAPVGSPEVLTALRDTYVDFNEAGGYTLAAVPNNDPEPAVTPGHVRVYQLTTDGTELVSVSLAQGVAPFPCLGPVVGAAELYATTLQVPGVANLRKTVRHTHADTSDWDDFFRPTWRTFTSQGTVSAGFDPEDILITSATPGDASVKFVGLPPDCVASFDIKASVFIAQPGQPYKVSFLTDAAVSTGRILAKRVAGTWTQIVSTLTEDRLVDPIPVSLADDGGGLVLIRFAFDASHILSPFRLTLEVGLHVLKLDA